MRSRRSGRQAARGQAMVEFALCFPLVLLLTVGLIGFGDTLQTVNDLATVVRDGARYASIDPGSYSCTGGATATSCNANTIQGVLQAEAGGVNVSAGGMPLANNNCIWSGSTTPPSLSVTPPLPTAPTNASGSCITVAYYANNSPGTLACAYYQTSSSTFINVNSGTCTATSSTSAHLWVEVTVAVTTASADPITITLSQIHITPLMSRSYAMAVAP